jgi:nitroreductase
MMTNENDLSYVIHHTRAMRRLKPDPVPEKLLHELIDAANQGPTGSNKQNTSWIVVRDVEQKKKLAELNKIAVEGYIDAPDSSAPERAGIVKAVKWQRDHFVDIPAILIPCLTFETLPADTWQAGADSGGSVWPAVQNVLLTARSMGLGAALTTLGLSNRPAAKKILGLPELVEPYAIIPVGYPMGKFGPVSRRPVEDVVHFDRW